MSERCKPPKRGQGRSPSRHDAKAQNCGTYCLKISAISNQFHKVNTYMHNSRFRSSCSILYSPPLPNSICSSDSGEVCLNMIGSQFDFEHNVLIIFIAVIFCRGVIGGGGGAGDRRPSRKKKKEKKKEKRRKKKE